MEETISVKALYSGKFSCWEDVKREFGEDIPEPKELIYAGYDIDAFEGQSIVIYRKGNNFFYQESHHCSCYGLEGLWEPESFNKKIFKRFIEDRAYVPKFLKEEIINMLKKEGLT